MKIFFVWLLLLFCGLNGLGQELMLRGVVRDQTDNVVLPGVGIFYEKNKGIATDINGRFELKLEAGTYTLIFQMMGYKPVNKTIALKDSSNNFLEVRMEQLAIEMDQVVVTASRIEQRVAELSVSMSVIKGDQVERQQITDAKELIDRAPGIEVLDGQASIRGGSGFSYGAGSRVLALVDGMPIIAADAGNIRWQFLPVDNLSQVEIIKGASSVAYGSSALNGVINFRTADASATPSTKVYSELGVYDSPRNINWKWWDSPRIFGAAGINHIQKLGNTDVGFGINGFSNSGYRLRNEDNALRMHGKIKHFDQKVKGLIYGLNLNGGLTRKTDFVLWQNADSGALVQDTSTAIALQGSFFAIDPYVSYTKNSKERHDLRLRLQRSNNVFPESEQNDSEALSLYAEYQLRKQFHQRLSLSTGLSASAANIQSKFYGDHNSFNGGAFAQMEIESANALKLVAGMRLEHQLLDGKAEKLVPLFRAGMNYKLYDYTYLRASFGQGYRFPSIAERHAATTLGSVKIFPNLFLEPEKGWNAELGIKQGVQAGSLRGQVDAALFYSEHRKMIEYIFGIYPNPGGETFSYGFRADNIEAARIYGFETEWMLEWTTRLLTHQLTGGYVWMFPAEFNPYTGKNTGEMLKYRRKHAAKLHYLMRFRKFDWGVNAYYRSGMLRVDDVFTNILTRESLLPGFYDYWTENNSGYLLMDVRLAYRFNDLMQLSLMVKNIGNVEYMGRPGDVQPQRSFLLRIGAAF